MPKLHILEKGTESVYEIFDDQNEVTIGRGAANAVQVHDSHASKYHASIRHMHGRLKLVDLESKNGTRVNGTFANQHWMTNGDTIQIGAAEMRFAGEDVAAPAPSAPAAPARPARPAAPRAARPPAPAAIGTPAASPRPAPAPAPSRAPARRSARPREDEGYDEEPRFARRRSSNSPVIVLLGGIGLALFAFLMFQMFAGGANVNHTVLVEAEKLYTKGEYEETISYIERFGRPEESHYERVGELLAKSRSKVEGAIAWDQRNQAAYKHWKEYIFHRSRTSLLSPAGALPEREVVDELRRFLTEWRGTTAATQLLNSDVAPYPEYRQMMQKYASDSVDPARVMGDIRLELEGLVQRRRYGEAIRMVELVRAEQRVLLVAERYQQLRRMADARIAQIRDQARSQFSADMADVDAMVSRGDRRGARRKLVEMIELYGLPKLDAEAQAKLAGL